MERGRQRLNLQTGVLKAEAFDFWMKQDSVLFEHLVLNQA
jgi:thiaminase